MNKNQKQQTFDDYILQTDLLNHINTKLGKETFLTCWENRDGKTAYGEERFGAYCAYIPLKKASKIMKNFGWDLSNDTHGPGFSVSHGGEKQIVKYHRFASSDQYLPLVIRRVFHGGPESYFDILEEFRLFHNLYENKKTGDYFKITEDGDKEQVIKISPNKIDIRLLEIRQFAAAKRMVLASFFDSTRYSGQRMSDSVKKIIKVEHIQKDVCYTRHGENDQLMSDDKISYSRICGKKIIQPLAIEKCGCWPFTDGQDQYENFIVGTDENGDHILSTCNEAELSNNFVQKEGAYHSLTPVFFRRDVLAKYYANTDKYEIEDGSLRCQSLWALRMDNNHPDHIMVFLSDLADMPYKEQKHWRSFNLTPEERSMSRANFVRSFLGNFHETESPDLLFKQSYKKLQEIWFKKRGWHVFLPLGAGDMHYFSSLRIPLNEQQSEFDAQIHGLAKLLVDSINVAGILKEYPISIPDELKGKSHGLYVFEQFLLTIGVWQADRYANFLRDIQGLRSSGTAHRKGENYQKIAKRLKIDEHGYKLICMGVFDAAESLMKSLIEIVEPDEK
jgi:hypothetical protein